MTEIEVQPTSDIELRAIVAEITDLRQRREAITRRLRDLIATISGIGANRTTWGPCTRCGHRWIGRVPDEPPRYCARCSSPAWQKEPRTARDRRPTDPPNPRWGHNRITGAKTNPNNKVGRRNHAAERWAKSKGKDMPPVYIVPPEPAIVPPVTPPPRLASFAPPVDPMPPVAPPPARPPDRFGLTPKAPPSGTSSTEERGTSTAEAAGSTPVSRSIQLTEFETNLVLNVATQIGIPGDGDITEESE